MTLKTLERKKDIFYLINKYSKAVSRVEAEMLLEYLFGCAKADLYIRDLKVDRTIEGLYDSLISRRLGGEPVQYITGHAEFRGMDFIVTKDTLIPRPETEILVDEIYNCKGRFQAAPRILDLCTGSGNIAVSLARLVPDAEIAATDISGAALKVAERNAERHNVKDRISFYKGDIFNALMFAKNPKFDIIVCNPPYIREAEIPSLQKEVQREPCAALNGGKDGLDFYRIIAKESRKYLKGSGAILVEIGFGQARAVEDIFSQYNIFGIYKIIKDFSGIERVMWINLS
ncbi:MAG: peptide chain release factor N(5)-glutamine methyltransferase [Candidatus Omnitrophota bacterium]|jgi:release factor glutamine methyltransferase